MSRAFVKDADENADGKLPDIPLSEHPNYVTPHGLELLRARLRDVESRREALAGAEETLGHQAELAALDRDLRWLKARVSSAIEIDLAQQPRDRIAFGAEVVTDSDEGEMRYRIVGEDEADAEHHLVSYVSPLARALIGARVGEEVLWHRPAGDLRLEVMSFDYGDDT
ncbi:MULTISPECIES: GreA/GreB family elongation factor [Dyella]|uniref:Transcription elongation factor GreAB n=2 Tax=Dyella TaxID=231454 RepID=A0A4R0YHI0_9GAMM|nr:MULTISPECIES: GreA/GreB family elongation factor [Dyella]TBR37091.1 transcription elongation factor GreAB [Dyella terrae]TCI07819.1 transcription elongation factor GreAB [Dyella soli]